MSHTHEKFSEIMAKIRPGAQYSLRGEFYTPEGLTMHTDTAPTAEEVAAGAAQVAAEEYKKKRAAEYPAIGDQLDALWKGGADADAMRAKIAAVKAKWPK